MKHLFFTGSYTEPILFGTGQLFIGKGEGVCLCSFEEGKIEKIASLPVRNPSFLTIDPDTRRIYAVNEMKEYNGEYGGGITEIGYSCSGEMHVIRSMGTGGTDPCHIAVTPDKRFVCTANFADGSVSVFPLDANGSLTGERAVFRHEGRSIHPVRQKGPHAHSILFYRDRMLVPDLGKDALAVYSLAGGMPERLPGEDIPVTPGSGPRFGEFSPDKRFFYLINELASSVTRFEADGKTLAEKETVSTLPDGFSGDNICSDLHMTPDGKYLYASNRGHDSIAGFSVSENGKLVPIGTVPCLGSIPRNFAIDPSGSYVLVGNQESDTIAVFRIGPDGQLSVCDVSEYPTPVCIRFLS